MRRPLSIFAATTWDARSLASLGRRANKRTRHRFTKAFDHKWMVAEPGGLFEGPSGKHSSRVGELKIGDIIKADAETFDARQQDRSRQQDHLEAARGHSDGREGQLDVRAVRGPKTAVPLNEALLKRVEEGVKFYKVNGKKGTIVRKEAAMDSDKVQIIESGTVVAVVATTELENGKVRYRIDEPIEGWVTSTQVDRWYKELPRSAFAK